MPKTARRAEKHLSIALYAPAAAAAATVAVIAWLLARGKPVAMDVPNERSLHRRPVPRLGGVAIVTGMVAAAACLETLPPWLAIAFALAVVSFFDDLRSLPALLRLAAHFAAAAAMVALLPIAVAWPLAVFFTVGTVWMTNLYNFMDGSDGLAGGMAVIGFASYGAAAWIGGETTLALLLFALVAATSGFLVFNFPPARVFLGDAGSVPLGFLAAAVGVLGWRVYALWPSWFPALVFSPFAVDATATLLKRIARREPFWRPHRDHYYQRLIRMGWSHRRTALAEYALMLACAAVALGLREAEQRVQVLALGAAAVAYAAIMLLVDRAWRGRQAGARGA
jgi:UDP-N-acetylmuramyl pentapeptide phosphotransferase/UDP-N-acetylglucosamine-1-phosphate transferase